MRRFAFLKCFKLAVLAVSVCALLGGCATQEDGKARVTQLHADQLGLPAGGASSAFQSQWWQAMGDPQLDALMTQALADNPTMAMAAARIRAAQATQALQGSAEGLHVDGRVSAERQRFSSYGLFPPPIGGAWYNLTDLGLSLNYHFDFWGKTRLRVTAAAGGSLAAQAEAYDAQLLLESGVASQYLAWLNATEARATAMRLRELAQAQVKVASAREKSGLDGKDIHAQTQEQVAQAQQREAYAIARSEQALHALAALTGQAPYALDKLTPRALPQWSFKTTGLTTHLLANRPDVMASLWQAKAANNMVKAAQADFYPDINFSALIGLEAQQLPDLFKATSLVAAFTPALSLPIFHNGELNAQLNWQAAHADLATAQYNQTLLNAAHDAADKLSTLNATAQAYIKAKEAFAAQERRHNSVVSRYKNGLLRRDAWLQSQQWLENSRLAVSDALAARLAAQVALVHALGGYSSEK